MSGHINYELESRINILKMIYSVVEKIDDNTLYCKQGNKATIVNKNGIELLSGRDDSLQKAGTFIKMVDNKGTTIYNIVTGKKLYINEVLYNGRLTAITNDIAIFKKGYSNLLFDKYLNILLDTDCGNIDCYVNNSKIHLVYNFDYFRFRRCTGYINMLNNKIECYDSYSLNDEFKLIATNWHKEEKIAINKNSEPKLKYKLMRHDSIVTDKEYEDITKPSELNFTDTLYTYEEINGKTKLGLIKSNGLELLEAIYDDIKHIGAGNYIVYNNSKKYIYNSNTFEMREISNIIIHDALPIVLIQNKNNEFTILTTKGTEFEIKDFTKHFKCCYSKERNDILRVELEYGFRYITNNFNTVRDRDIILNSIWIPINAE